MNPMQAPNVGVGGKDHGNRSDNFTPEKDDRCAHVVFDGVDTYKCGKKNGHGHKFAFCKQHAIIFPAY